MSLSRCLLWQLACGSNKDVNKRSKFDLLLEIIETYKMLRSVDNDGLRL